MPLHVSPLTLGRKEKMNIRDIIPKSEIQLRHATPLSFTEYGFADMSHIIRELPDDVLATSLNVWNRIVQYRIRPVNPQALVKWVFEEDPAIFREIERIISRPVFTDAAYLSAAIDGREVASISLFRVFPNSVHLADILFRDYTRPLPPEQRIKDRTHHGYGLLSTVITRMRNYAIEHKIDYLTLTAARGDLVPLFEKHGFKVEDNEMARRFLVTNTCIPMELKL